MAAIVWDRKNKVIYPRNGVFADATEANAWIRRNHVKSGTNAGASTLDVVTVNTQAG